MPDTPATTQAPGLAARLLPPNRTPLESAVVRAVHATDHPERTLATLYQARGERAVAAPLLPWLAWSVDVLAWPRQADETLRRTLAARSWGMHRRMGTLAGLREIAAVFRGEIQRAITPPAKVFAAPSLTRAERNAFVARYPQLRIYRWRTVGERQGAMLASSYLGRAWPLTSDAVARIAPRAYLWQDGAETELAVTERVSTTTTRQAQAVTEVRAAGRAGPQAFLHALPHPARFPGRSSAAQRIYRLRLAQTYQDRAEQVLRRELLHPGLAPIDVRRDEVAVPGQATGLFLGGAPAARPCTHPSTARDRLFQRLYLFDPDIEVRHRRASLHLGAGARLGMPPHHAELRLVLTSKGVRQATGRYVRGHLVATDKTRLNDCLASLRDVARASDRIDIDTHIRKPAAAGVSALAGELIAGQWVDA